jgi:hypothetical protein
MSLHSGELRSTRSANKLEFNFESEPQNKDQFPELMLTPSPTNILHPARTAPPSPQCPRNLLHEHINVYFSWPFLKEGSPSKSKWYLNNDVTLTLNNVGTLYQGYKVQRCGMNYKRLCGEVGEANAWLYSLRELKVCDG